MPISNPFASPLFLPTLYTVGGLLASSLLGLLAVVRFSVHRLRQSTLFMRWRVWAVVAALYGLAILSGQLTTLVLLAFLVYQSLREYAKMTGLPLSYERAV